MARRKRATFLSKQAPLSLQQRTRRIFIWVGAVLAVLLLACTGAYFYLISWLQGDGFRQYLTDLLKQASKAKVVQVPENLSVDGAHMTLPSCTLKQAPLFRSLELRKLHIEADRAAALRRELKLKHLSVESLQLTINGRSAAAESQGSAPLSAPARQAANKGFFKSIQLPTFESHYTDTKFLFGKDSKQAFSLSGYHLVAEPRTEAGNTTWAIGIENGRILTPFSWLRESGLKSAALVYRGDEIQLSDSQVLLTPGDLRAKGVYRPATGQWNAHLEVQQADVARILSDDWRKRLTGRLWGQVEMNGLPGSWQARGQVRLEDGLLEGLPILSDLKLHGTTPYRSISLEKASCTLTYPYSEPELGIRDAWLWDRIDIRAAKSALLVRGRVIIGSDGSLSGSLSIGLPKKTLVELGLDNTPVISQLFNAPVQMPGYAWVHVNLSGTIDAPQEDISVRLATILPQALPGMAGKAVKSLNSVLGRFLPEGALPKPQEEPETDKDTDKAQQAPAPAPKKPSSGSRKIQDAIKAGLDMFL